MPKETDQGAQTMADADEERDLAVSSDDYFDSGLMLARLPLSTRVRQQPRSVDELPQELVDAIHNPAVLEHGVPYINTAYASNEMVDSYGTRMRPTSLRNYADDATNGIALQNSHRTNELPLGRTFLGRFKAVRSPQPARTEMDFFIPPGINVSGVNTSDVIKAIDYGSVRDVSIGFYGGELRCSLDGKPMMGDLLSLLMFGGGDDAEERDPNAPCNHLPGVEYAVRDAHGKKTGEKAVAIGEVEGAHCAELSLVFDGATPMAQIAGRSAPVFAKAYKMAEMEVLPRPIALALESRYRGVRFPAITTTRMFMNGTHRQTDVENEEDGLESRAVWTTEYKNNLPDSAFALILPGGEKDSEGKTTPRSLRKLPHHAEGGAVDEDHLRNALSRAPQMSGVSDAQRSSAVSHLNRHAKSEGIGEDNRATGGLTVMPDEENVRKAAKPAKDSGPPPATKDNPDPDHDGDDDTTAEGDTDHSHFNADGSKKNPKEKRMPESQDSTASGPPPGADTSAERGQAPAATATDEAERAVSGLRSALVSAGLAPEGFSGDLATRFVELGREVSDLRGWADIGRQARERLVEDCKKEGVRAFGASYRETAYGVILTRGSFAELQDLHTHFLEMAGKRFSGGRATEDAADKNPPADADTAADEKKPTPLRVPARAYRA